MFTWFRNLAWYRAVSPPVRTLGLGTLMVLVIVAMNWGNHFRYINPWVLIALGAALAAGWVYVAIDARRKARDGT